jgi:hypothetical protein
MALKEIYYAQLELKMKKEIPDPASKNESLASPMFRKRLKKHHYL